MTENKIVDCRGLACPQPVIMTKETLAGAPARFVVIVDNEGSATNVRRFAEGQGARVSVEEQGGDFHLLIEAAESSMGQNAPTVNCEPMVIGRTVVFVGSEGMGRGDEELGSILMEAFLDTLSQFKGEISHAIFVNGGAKLAVEGSPVLEQLRQLEQVGVDVMVCGTCLNFFDITDQLAVGSVSNMYAIIEKLSQAGRVIRP